MLSTYIRDTWGKVHYYARIPEGVREGDELRMFVWNTGSNEMLVKNLCLSLYQ